MCYADLCASYRIESFGGNTVRSAEFRDRLEGALQEAGLLVHDADRRVETIELADTVRRRRVYIIRAASRSTEPFRVSAEIGFDWSPVDAARAYTSEEDLLTELIGRRRLATRTQRRWTGVDLSLHASLPYGSTTSMPESHVVGAWSTSAGAHVQGYPRRVDEERVGARNLDPVLAATTRSEADRTLVRRSVRRRR